MDEDICPPLVADRSRCNTVIRRASAGISNSHFEVLRGFPAPLYGIVPGSAGILPALGAAKMAAFPGKTT
jgi:hypothetical protein